jgi:uncharacterized damage-inducible protein DinB
MNVVEQLENAHLLVIQTLDNLPELEWDMPMSEGGWTVKDTVAHLTSYEHLLLDICHIALKDSSSTPYATQFAEQGANFNQTQVAAYSNHTAQQVIDEFEEVQAEVTGLLAQIPTEAIEKKGIIPARADRSLSNFVSVLSEHIRRHCDEITAFRTREKQ